MRGVGQLYSRKGVYVVFNVCKKSKIKYWFNIIGDAIRPEASSSLAQGFFETWTQSLFEANIKELSEE